MASAEVQQLLALLADSEADPNDVLERLEAVATADDLPMLRGAIAADDSNYLGEILGPVVGAVEGVSALPFLLSTFRRGEERGADHDGLAFAITELVTLNPEEAVPLLAEMARSPTAGHRRDAAWLWGYVAEAAPLEPLLELSRDPDWHVAGNALGALASYKGREEVFARLAEAAVDADDDIRVSAISALGYFDDPRAVPLLEPAADAGPESVRQMARHALRQLGRPGD